MFILFGWLISHHILADYVLQRKKTLEEKHWNDFAMMEHQLVYTTVLGIGLFVYPIEYFETLNILDYLFITTAFHSLSEILTKEMIAKTDAIVSRSISGFRTLAHILVLLYFSHLLN